MDGLRGLPRRRSLLLDTKQESRDSVTFEDYFSIKINPNLGVGALRVYVGSVNQMGYSTTVVGI
jgi:hypothetical protein